MGGRSGSSTTVVNNLPEYAEQYVTQYLSKAYDFFSEEFPTYSGTTYASQDSNEIDAIAALAARGRNGNQTISKAVDHVKRVIDGEYLNGTRSEFLAAKDKALTKPRESFETRIKTLLGGTLLLVGDLSGENHAQDLSVDTADRQLNRAEAEMYGRNYDFERKIQKHVLSYGPAYASQSAKDAELLRMAGIHGRIYTQGSYEDIYKKWLEDQAREIRRLEILGNALRSLVGTQETTTQPYHRTSPMAAMAGGALSGASLGPWGALAGAAVGLLSSQ